MRKRYRKQNYRAFGITYKASDSTFSPYNKKSAPKMIDHATKAKPVNEASPAPSSKASLTNGGATAKGFRHAEKAQIDKRKLPEAATGSTKKKKAKDQDLNTSKQGSSQGRGIQVILVSDDEGEEPPALVPNVVNPNVYVRRGMLTFDLTTPETTPKKRKKNFPLGRHIWPWLIGPTTSKDFFKTYWEKRPLHLKREKPNYYEDILTSEGLDRMVRFNDLHYTRNVDVVSYENGKKESHNQEGRALPSSLWDYYNNGCSVRVLNPQTYNKNIHYFLVGLQEIFGSMMGANVYLTPPNSQGFAPHFDDIEAFILQLEGRKHWKLYHPKSEDVLARYSSPNFNEEDLGEPFESITLNAGDLLYFPRGTIHQGRTDEDSHSLHITISTYQNTSYADLLEHLLPTALKKATENDVAFRKGLPLHYLKKLGFVNEDKETPTKEKMLNKLTDLITKLVDHMNIDDAVDQMGRKLVRDTMPPVLTKSESGRSRRENGDCLKNGKVVNRIEIDMSSYVRLVKYYAIRLVSDEAEGYKLYYSTENSYTYQGDEEQHLTIGEDLVAAVKTLQESFPRYIEVETLPIEDMGLKTQFVFDLWELGILLTKDPLVGSDEEDSN